MAGDLTGGGLFFSTISFLCYVISVSTSLWWFTTIELEGQMCSCGTGLWSANITWGDDLTESHLNFPVICTQENPLVTDRCDALFDGQDETRWKGKLAGICSILSIGLMFLSMIYGFKHHLGNDSNDFAKRASFVSIIAAFFQFLCIVIFSSSPLYSNFMEDFQCHFSFLHPLNSNQLKCHALGPSWAVAAIGTIFGFVASILFYFSYAPTKYLHDSTGRYSLFMDEFEKHNGYLIASAETSSSSSSTTTSNIATSLQTSPQYLMRRGETSPPTDKAGPFRKFLRAYGIPLLLVCNLALFVYSNCSTGATVEPHIIITFPKELRNILRFILPMMSEDGIVELRDDVFNFTLVSSLRHFWTGHAYGLAFLIGLFSGLWPYVKLVFMLFLWFVPSSERLRGRLLHWLDILGKWSLVDAYVLCLMTVAFAFQADKSILGIRIQVDIAVRPGWGVYSFVLATMWSLSMSHWITYKHRHAIERRKYSPTFLSAMGKPPFESLSSRPYAPNAGHRRFKCTKMGRLLILFLVGFTTLIAIIGQTINSFDFEFSGLIELLLDPDDLVSKYSLVSLGQKIPSSAKHGGYLSGGNWATFITVMYFLFALIIPMTRLILLLVLWFLPLTLKGTRRLFHLIEVISAWSAMDVFLISVIAAVMEIGGLSQDVISSGFGSIQDTVCELLVSLPPIFLDSILDALGLPRLDLSQGCALFRVDAVLMNGCWMILYALIACEICSHIIMELADASLSERRGLLAAYQETITIRPGTSGDDLRGNSRSRIVPSTSQENVSNNNRPSQSMRRLLSAQEQGANEFTGSYFDCMYGPFPRKMWAAMSRTGLMTRVEWRELDLHEEMVPRIVSEQQVEEEEEDSVEIRNGGGGSVGSDLEQRSSTIVSGNNIQIPLLNEYSNDIHVALGSTNDESWIAESPFSANSPSPDS